MRYTITKAELKETSKGSILKVDLKDENGNFENGVTIWSSYASFNSLKVGSEINGTVDVKQNGQYTNKSFKEERTNTLNRAPKSDISKVMDRKEKSIEKTMDRKEGSMEKLATFRDATLLTSAWVQNSGELISVDEMKSMWVEWKKWLEGKIDEPFL